MSNKYDVVNPDLLKNLAEGMDKKKLEKIGQVVYDGYRRDNDSRTEWVKQRQEVAKLFAINRDGITARWEGGSNIGLSVLTMACIQFQARAARDLLPAKDILMVDSIGQSIEDMAAADRVERYMNYQLDYDMEEYRDSMDLTFLKQAIDGTVVRKTYYDTVKKRNVSDWVSGYDFIVNNATRYLTDSPRYSENLWPITNDIKIKMKNGTYLKYDNMNKGTQNTGDDLIRNQYLENMGTNSANFDETIAPRHLIEQHVLLDLDDLEDKEGVEEPYIITIDHETKNVLRIVSRRNPKDEKVIMEYYTPFHFLPNPDGFYSYGFGLLLKDANEGMNKIINDLIDCGTLQNTPMGIMLEGAGFEPGDMDIKMGEYKSVKLNTDDIRKALFNINIAQPSTVLFALLGTLQQYQDRLTTVTETATGDLAKSGTSATAVVAAVEQGEVVFNAIYSRNYRAMRKDFQKMYVLNSIYLDIDAYYKVVVNPALLEREDGTQADPENIKDQIKTDFQREADLKPVADISVISRKERAAKAHLLRQTVLEYEEQLLTQITHPQSVYLSTVNFLKSVDINPTLIESTIIAPPPEPEKPDLPQEEENVLFFKEQYTEPLPEQDHSRHMVVIAEFRKSVYAEQLTPNGQEMLEQHQREHIGLLYAEEVTEKEQLLQQEQQGQL